jgi:hypothetical protein
MYHYLLVVLLYSMFAYSTYSNLKVRPDRHCKAICMAIPSAPHRTVTDSQHMSANGSPASRPILLDTPRDDKAPESAGHYLPSTRVIELETLLRQRDAQNEKLTVGRL